MTGGWCRAGGYGPLTRFPACTSSTILSGVPSVRRLLDPQGVEFGKGTGAALSVPRLLDIGVSIDVVQSAIPASQILQQYPADDEEPTWTRSE